MQGTETTGGAGAAQVKQVSGLVARRSAALVAACLAGLLRQIGRDGSAAPMRPTTIAVDGGLFEHYQAYRGYLRQYLDQLLGKRVSCTLRSGTYQPHSGASQPTLWRLRNRQRLAVSLH